MLRKDGTYTFYKIQHLEKNEKWVYSNLTFFCKGKDFTVGSEPYRSFTAIGKCWQEIGECGCYDLPVSLSFLKQISQAWPDCKFRLVKIKSTQKTITEVKHCEKKAKWKVEAKYETKEELNKLYREAGEDPEDFDIEEFNGVEISVVREDDKARIESYYWGGMDKIILFEDDEYDKEDIEWCKLVAETVCEALNKKKL